MPFPHIRIVDPEHVWQPMPIGRAIAWSRVLHRRVPVWPGGAGMWVVANALKQGRPAGIAEWAARAHEAEAVGLTAARYDDLQQSLDRLWPDEFASHPDNDLDRRALEYPVRRFDVRLWAPWAQLCVDGLSDDEATATLLTAADAAAAVPPLSDR